MRPSSRTVTVLRRLCSASAQTGSARHARCFTQTASTNASYGFVGLGRMGLPMARNLRQNVDSQDTVTVYDTNSTATERFLTATDNSQHSFVAKDVHELVANSDTIIVCLPEPAHVASLFNSILAQKLPSQKRQSLYIDCSTIDPITSRAVAEKVAHASAGRFVDAPMSGGVVGAEARTLTFMLGCDDDLLEPARHTLGLMGKRVVHMGRQGNGVCAKLANNYLLALNNIATAEAMSMGIAWGLDAKALADMINTSTGKCWPSMDNNPVPGVNEKAPSSRGYEGGFAIGLMSKDLRLAMESVSQFGVKNGLGSTALDLYRAAEQSELCRGKDFSSIYRWLEGPQS